MTAPPTRPLPQLTELNRAFWTSGADGRLRIQRCGRCRRLIHPPAVLCPDDHSDALDDLEVAGTGEVVAWTVNRHTWFPDLPAPYVVAYVALDEDPRARLLTNLVHLDGAEPHVGMRVRVTFERHRIDDDELFVPLFEPDV